MVVLYRLKQKFRNMKAVTTSYVKYDWWKPFRWW